MGDLLAGLFVLGVGLAILLFIRAMIKFAATRPEEFKRMSEQLSENSYRRKKRS